MAKEKSALGLKRGVVRLADHNSEWPRLYEEEAGRLRKSIGDLVDDIQHVGSTSVPDLVAKPILDIAIAIPIGSESSR